MKSGLRWFILILLLTVVGCAGQPATGLSSLQKQQLVVIRAIVKGYNGPDDVCQWKEPHDRPDYLGGQYFIYLVECDTRGQAIRLNLSGIGLVNLPPEIGQLSNLQELDLSSNPLTGLPPEIGQLAALQCFALSENQLSSLRRETCIKLKGAIVPPHLCP